MKIIKINIITIIMTTCILLFYGCNNKVEDKTKDNKYMQSYTEGSIFYDNSFWDAPKTYTYEETVGVKDPLSTDKIKAVFYKGSNYKGEETRIFAYISFPENASKENKVPAVILVHGGGGTAYKEWINEWTKRGYAALAIDYQGNMPLKDCVIDTQNYVEIPGYTAPKNIGFAETDKDKTEDHWMYYATSAVIISNSLMRSYEQIDNTKIGLVGISWGSYISSITMGYDDRFSFVIPIYGGLNNSESNAYFKDFYKQHPNALIWDDLKPIQQSKTPIYFNFWLKDNNFTLNSITKTFNNCQNAEITVKENWWHSHSGGMFINEPYLFADRICKNENKQIRITKYPTDANNSLEYTVPEGNAVSKIELFLTSDIIINENTLWTKKTVTNLTDIKAYLNPNTKYYFINITDTNNNEISTKLLNV